MVCDWNALSDEIIEYRPGLVHFQVLTGLASFCQLVEKTGIFRG